MNADAVNATHNALDLRERAAEDEPTFREVAIQTLRTGKRYVQANPIKSVGVAFGAGLLLSAVAKRGVLRVVLLIAAEKLTQVVVGGLKGRARTSD